MIELTETKMREALNLLATHLDRPLTLLIGGGGAMLLAYHFPLGTSDIDAIPKGYSTDELKPFIEKVALELELPNDWLNPWFATFTYILPLDFEQRLKEVFNSGNLKAQALGPEDILLMKCFAHRQKDIPHARALLRLGANFDSVFDQIDLLEQKKIPRCQEAREFLEHLLETEKG